MKEINLKLTKAFNVDEMMDFCFVFFILICQLRTTSANHIIVLDIQTWIVT